MPAQPLTPEALARAVAEFEANGAVVFRDSLSSAEVQMLRETFAANRQAKPLNWTLRGKDRTIEDGPTGESGRWQTDEVLRTDTGAIAVVARHPPLMQLVSELIGPSARFSGVGAMWREPVPEAPPPTVPPAYAAAGIHWQLWHREAGGHHAPSHSRCIPSLQCIFYLDDCDATSHCFSYVPESVAQKQALPLEPGAAENSRISVKRDSPTGSATMWTNKPLAGRPGWPFDLGSGTDVLAPAGSLIVLNNNNLHAGTVRGPTDRPRRTLHVSYALPRPLSRRCMCCLRECTRCVYTQARAHGWRRRYHNKDAYSGSAAEAHVPVPVPEGVASAAVEAAREFAASVPSEWRWMYEVGQLVRDHFGRADSGYPDQTSVARL